MKNHTIRLYGHQDFLCYNSETAVITVNTLAGCSRGYGFNEVSAAGKAMVIRMVSKTVKVADKMGLHMRPANIFVTEMCKFSSDITLAAGDKDINGKSIMNIMAACIKYGTEVTVKCEGADEQAMLEKAVSLIESGMDD